MIQKEAWSFYKIISGVRQYWELEEPKGLEGPKGLADESHLCEHEIEN